MRQKQIDLIIDLQFGSTGKGLLAGYLAHMMGHDTIMTAWAPNAGHTYIDYDGRKFVHTMLCNGLVGPAVKRIMIGPGSLLNLDSLEAEIQGCMDIIEAKKISIFIHGHAGVVTAHDIAMENEGAARDAIGSTKKGVGAAAISKIRRRPGVLTLAKDFDDHPVFDHEFVYMVHKPESWLGVLDMADKILVEGAQGFGLSIQHGFYPYTTSRDVTPHQILADCGVPYGHRARVWGTARTFPIRVANRYDENGAQVGWSGPCYDDQIELDWERDMGMKPELTTVTKLPRRIFTYSHEQMYFATAMCGAQDVFLNFTNYLKSFSDFQSIMDSLHQCHVRNVLYGAGPSIRNIVTGIGYNARDDWEAIQKNITER